MKMADGEGKRGEGYTLTHQTGGKTIKGEVKIYSNKWKLKRSADNNYNKQQL